VTCAPRYPRRQCERSGEGIGFREKRILHKQTLHAIRFAELVGAALSADGMSMEYAIETAAFLFRCLKRDSAGCGGQTGIVGFEWNKRSEGIERNANRESSILKRDLRDGNSPVKVQDFSRGRPGRCSTQALGPS